MPTVGLHAKKKSDLSPRRPPYQAKLHPALRYHYHGCTLTAVESLPIFVRALGVMTSYYIKSMPWLLIFGFLLVGVMTTVRSQDAAAPGVDLQSSPTPSPPPASPAPALSPAPAPTVPPDIPSVPELSKLDEAFKQSSLGKEADELRVRLECRKLQNRIANEPQIVAAKQSAEHARTDLEKRNRLRDYYNIYYGRMESLASDAETKKAIEAMKTQHLRLLDQPRVRPVPGGTIPPPAKEKKQKHSKFAPGT